MTSRYVNPGPLKKCLEVPTSKSHANRLLVLASIAREEITISNISKSSDVVTMMRCLRELGLEIAENGSDVTVRGSFPECEKKQDDKIKIRTGDGGTTTRFLCALLARGSNCYEIIPDGHMVNRPMEPLKRALSDLGVKIESEKGRWLTIQGPYNHEGHCIVNCKESTQFLSALMMGTVDKNIILQDTGVVSSNKYLEITKRMVKSFREGNLSYRVPIDASSLSYPLSLAAVTGEVTITNCFSIDKDQADSKIVDILEQVGSSWTFSEYGLHCRKNKLKAFKVDGSECPDLVPTLAFLAAHVQGQSVLHNLAILRHKESDRIKEIMDLLDLFHVSYRFDDKTNDLFIDGPCDKIDREMLVKTAPDHRIIMTAYLFLRCHSGGTLYHTKHVSKSFTDFFTAFEN